MFPYKIAFPPGLPGILAGNPELRNMIFLYGSLQSYSQRRFC